ncbi:hypothetical protein HYC85_018848 [Camellia sinensis]|uniref:Non-haem dioxygenase N-terminal domain-containing protein n=1 Tax=Camellia sinensis TaxID=4442 RepID=A0A7J7GXQ6_CAMSI|nr:hypothetical protein HYC85_018848 [Camellia sinensis]
MEAKLARLGSSLLVPSVQELAKESLTTVPPRYVHHDHQNHPNSSYGARCPDDVPIIDMDKLISRDHMDLELKKLNYASKEWGFFQAQYSKVDGPKFIASPRLAGPDLSPSNGLNGSKPRKGSDPRT